MHTLSDAEGIALHHLAVALRPDWTANNPGQIIHAHQTQHGGLPEATDFPHTVRAMLAYATATGTERKRTPNLYVADGKHWASTAPRPTNDVGMPPRELWCPDHNRPESRCRDQHAWAPPPPGWKTWRETTEAATSPTPEGDTP